MKLKASFETEVYLSEGGYLTIKQRDPLDDDAIVCLTHEQVKLLAAELARWAEKDEWWEGVERNEDEPY